MKKIRVEDAVGQRLCHDITAMRDGFKGAAFRRGHVISKKDIEALLAIGKKHIFIWEDKAGKYMKRRRHNALPLWHRCRMHITRDHLKEKWY